MAFSRRRLFQLSLAGSAVVAAGGALRWFDGGYALLPGEVALGGTVKSFCVVRALVEALLPADAGMPGGVALGVPQRVDEEFWSAPQGIRDDLLTGVQLLEHGPPIFGFHGRFTRLPLDERAACFDAMLRSDKGFFLQMSVAFKQMLHLFYYGDPRVWPAIGYAGPFVPDAVPPASSVAYRALLDAARGAA